MLRLKHKKAQSALEYILVLTAIVVLIIYAAANWIKPAVQQSMTDAQTAIGDAADELNTAAPGP